MKTITATIKREWLAQIIAGSKRIEYRDASDFWISKLQKAEDVPFGLRLINGMKAQAPEATIEVLRVFANCHEGQFEFHLGKVIDVQNWQAKASDSIKFGSEALLANVPKLTSTTKPAFTLSISAQQMSTFAVSSGVVVLIDDTEDLMNQLVAAGAPPYVVEIHQQI